MIPRDPSREERFEIARFGMFAEEIIPELEEQWGNDWEYGFYDSESPAAIWWHCFGLPFTTPEMARHTAEKNVWGHVVVVRRHPGAVDWEHVEEES